MSHLGSSEETRPQFYSCRSSPASGQRLESIPHSAPLGCSQQMLQRARDRNHERLTQNNFGYTTVTIMKLYDATCGEANQSLLPSIKASDPPSIDGSQLFGRYTTLRTQKQHFSHKATDIDNFVMLLPQTYHPYKDCHRRWA